MTEILIDQYGADPASKSEVRAANHIRSYLAICIYVVVYTCTYIVYVQFVKNLFVKIINFTG